MILRTVLIVLGSYLFGNINNALIISKLKGSDVRKKDSGNPGAMNMIRNFGKALGALTLFLDAVKGAIPCLLGWYVLGQKFSFAGSQIGAYVAGLSVIVGHIFPIFLRFKGGKGIASSIGVCMVIHPLATLVTFVLGFIFLAITHMGAATSFLIISIPVMLKAHAASAGGDIASCVLLFCLIMLTLFAHRGNVFKLFAGKENKTILFGSKQKTKNVSQQ